MYSVQVVSVMVNDDTPIPLFPQVEPYRKPLFVPVGGVTLSIEAGIQATEVMSSVSSSKIH
jgi:hypothetical protein